MLVTFKGPSELPREIERNMGISEDVLRCLIIKLEEKKHSVKPASRAPRGACGRACRSCRGSRSRCRAACRNPAAE